MQGNFKKFQKTPLLLSILFLGFSCLIFFFLNRAIKNNIADSEQIQIVWQNEANKIEELKSLDSLLEKTKEKRILLESYFIHGSDDAVSFLDIVEKLAEDAGGKAEVVLVDIPKDNSGLVVEMKATGRFEALYKFLTLLENSPYEIELISMDIKKLGGETLFNETGASSLWSATFRIKLLSFIQSS